MRNTAGGNCKWHVNNVQRCSTAWLQPRYLASWAPSSRPYSTLIKASRIDMMWHDTRALMIDTEFIVLFNRLRRLSTWHVFNELPWKVHDIKHHTYLFMPLIRVATTDILDKHLFTYRQDLLLRSHDSTSKQVTCVDNQYLSVSQDTYPGQVNEWWERDYNDQSNIWQVNPTTVRMSAK